MMLIIQGNMQKLMLMPDSPLPPELLQAMKEYRQKLRDITKDFENPDDVVFPINPLEVIE